ncbi:MAG: PDZ domain-containing protein, partial [Verrucomicrobia bacterium]
EEGEEGEAEEDKEQGAGLDLEKLLRESLRRGNLDLDEEDLKKLGGMAELEKALREMADSIGPEALRDMLEMEIQSGPDDFFASAMKSLQPVTSKAARSVVSVGVNGKPAALGTVVSDNGHILTKNVETLEGEVSRKGEEGQISLKLIKRFPKRDLALYQGSPEGLEPVKWVGKKKSPIGTLLTSPDPDGAPLGIGLVSVLPRALGEIGFLGIQAGEGENGVEIVRIVNGSPAEEAGLQANDVITHVDGIALQDPFAFGSKIRTYRAGDKVEFTYQRGEKVDKVKVKLAARPQEQSSDRFRRMNEMSGPLSERLSGFPLALQHDMPISPVVCGGPLLDLQGRCIGINVSRAGRVKTLAIPASDIRKLLSSVDELDAKKPAEPPVAVLPSDPAPSDQGNKRDKELDEVLEELRSVKGKLQQLEKRLELLRK